MGLAATYAQRVNLTVAIIAMTVRNGSNPDFQEYNWDEKEKLLLVSSFFWGYVLTLVPAGQLSHKFGGKVTFLYGLLISSLLTILTPLCADIGDWQLVCALRVLQGLCQGLLFPSTLTIISKWAPVEERGALVTYAYTGELFGAVVMLVISGVLACSPLGWPSIFYISGAVGLVWSVIFYRWAASSPHDCKFISPEEKRMIETSLGQDVENEEQPKRSSKIPWTKFLHSAPFLALIIVHAAHSLGFLTLLTGMDTSGMDIESYAQLSALPYLVMFLLGFVFCTVAAELSRRKCLKLSTNRKLFNSIGQLIPMLSLITVASYTEDETNLEVALLTIAMGMAAATFVGFMVNHIDLSPKFSGILMGITSGAANVMGIIAMPFVGSSATGEKNPDQWRVVAYVAAAFYLIASLLFVTLGDTSGQSWNEPEDEPHTSKRNTSNVQSHQTHNEPKIYYEQRYA